MRAFARLLLPLFAVSFAAAGLSAERTGVARARDTWAIASPAASSPRAAALALVARIATSSAAGDTLDLAPPVESQSIAGRHFYFAQTVGGIPVLNGGLSVSVYPDGSASLHDRTAPQQLGPPRIGDSEAVLVAAASGRRLGATEVESVALVGWIGDDGQLRAYRRVVVRNGLRRHAVMVDAESGTEAWIEPLFATARGQVFDSNPVTSTNDPTLGDGDDAASAVPPAAYAKVDLAGLDGSGPLSGPLASIVDLEIPATARADQAAPLELTRDRDEFEEVNAYFQIDRAQRYLRELGFVAGREIVPYAIEIDPHASAGADESSYRYSTPGRGRLFFGDGGVDDAEDADIVVHEFAHAIQDSIVPSGFTGPSAGEARALGEGFSDYWAFSASWDASRASGRDPYCIGDWDARCSPGASTQCGYEPGANCLRRVDSAKTMDDYLRGGSSGTEHINGQIWSSMLREIFVKTAAERGDVAGRRLVDRTLLESHFGLPPNPTFRTATLRFIDADRRLNDGALTPAICAAASARGIVDASECDLGMRGDLTLVASPARDVAIPDFDPNGITATLRVTDTRVAEAVFVRVDVTHPNRGDLRLTLIAPDGTSVVLQVENGEVGDDIHAVYGLDAEPAQPLSTVAGKSAAGIWTLKIVDTVGADVGRLVSWGVMFRFAGDDPIVARGPAGTDSRFIPVTGSVHGAFGTHYVSDVRIANIGTTPARLTMFYTPSGTNGLASCSAMKLEVSPGETVALDDIGTSLFRESGTGAIEIRGDTAEIVVTSRIYNDTGEGTYGQFVRVGSPSADRASGTTLHVSHLALHWGTHSNLGLTEVGGAAGTVTVRIIDFNGILLATKNIDVVPFGHVQIPAMDGPSGLVDNMFRAEVSVSAGDARVIAYGSTIDDATGDAIFVPGLYYPWVQVTPPADPFIVPAVIRAPGANGTVWTSDVRIANPGNVAPQRVAVTYVSADGNDTQTATLEIGPGATAVLYDVLGRLFSRSEGRGSLSILSLDSGDTRASVVVTSRTWTPGGAGTYGQYIPAIPRSEAITRFDGEASLIHVDSTDRFRCNVGLTEVSGAGATVRVRMLDATSVARFATDVAVPARGNVQFNLRAAGAPAISNARLTFEVTSASGRVIPYASVVDNATGDPIFVSR